MTTNPPLRNGWMRFWFTPADPTTLGFMRIVGGLLALYLHLAYCFDLQRLFGPKAWWSLHAANTERLGFPYVTSGWKWPDPNGTEGSVISFRIPDTAHRREAVMKFLRSLPENQDARRAKLAYPRMLVEGIDQGGVRVPPPDQAEADNLLTFIERLPTDDVERIKKLDAVRTAKPDPLNVESDWKSPRYLRDLPEVPPNIRLDVSFAAEIFYNALPHDKDRDRQAEERGYVLDWLHEILPSGRLGLVKFLEKLPSDPAECAKVFEYLEQWSVDPNEPNAIGKPTWSLYFHVTTPAGMWLIHIAVLVAIVLFTLGLWTRVTSVLAWAGAIGYIHRSEMSLFGMDTMMNVLLIYLMIAPSGHALSLDRWREKKRLLRYVKEKGGPIDPAIADRLANPPKSVLANFMTRMIQIHFCFIYMASGLAKLKGDAWWFTDALWYTMVNPEFCPFPLPGYENFVHAISSFRPVYHTLMAGGVAFTLVLEIGLPFLVWTRLRPYMVIGGVLMHFGIAVFMGLAGFSLFMMTLLLSYMPPEVIRRWVREETGKPDLPAELSQNGRLPEAAPVTAMPKKKKA